MKIYYADSRFLITKPDRPFCIGFVRKPQLYALQLGRFDIVMRRGRRLEIPRHLCRYIAEHALGARR